jgi:hypothetical protein
MRDLSEQLARLEFFASGLAGSNAVLLEIAVVGKQRLFVLADAGRRTLTLDHSVS